MQGARWCRETKLIQESLTRQIFDQLPIIWLEPRVKNEDKSEASSDQLSYKCPVYITSVRRGELSTTGHSSNYVFTIKVPSDMKETHWINRGTF